MLYLGFATGRVKISFPTSDVSAVLGIAGAVNSRMRWLLNKETARAVKNLAELKLAGPSLNTTTCSGKLYLNYNELTKFDVQVINCCVVGQ